MEIGKIGMNEISKILKRNRDTMLKSNVLGSDFSFLRHGPVDLVFKIEPMVFYKTLSVQDNGLLSVVFSINDFVTSGTWPSISMIDFEKPASSGNDFFEYINSVFRYLKERRVQVASGHTGSYGNLGYGVAGTMALLGFKRQLFSFKRIRNDDSFYVLGNLGKELSFFRRPRVKNGYKAIDLSIEKYIKELLKIKEIVHYAHDISEGGLVRALKEISALTHFGFNVKSRELNAIAARGVEEYGSRIFSSSSSGSLVVSVYSRRKEEFEELIKRNSWPFLEIERRGKRVTLDNRAYNLKDSVLEFLS